MNFDFQGNNLSSAEFQKTMELANKAIELSKTHHTPPVPKVYEVWYSYAAGGDGLICDRIDAIIDNGSALSIREIDQIHGEFFSSIASDQSQHNEMGLKLEQEMDGIIKLVQSYLVSNDRYAGSLNHTVETLSDASKPTQVRKTIEFLIAENAKMQGETAKLTVSLEQSKSQVQRVREELARSREMEMRDPLTNLRNRRWFEASLAKDILHANAADSFMCLVLMDIDHFKMVNDTHGHLVGDQVINFFASQLKKNFKGRDTTARIGGEEFAIILPSTTLDDAKILIERLRAELEKTNLVISQTREPIGKVTASFGIAQIREGDDVPGLVHRADTMLYQAKNSGRNRVACDTPVVA